ncbi:hypothetical protein [Ectobacillus funiculus]|uniref:hypothetical protein n=1 Tax=Ectobacillus funiculus TaxID=137993 RepID=UPI00196A95D4|nr:hypothetical protein [Ectobacillus funiculus]
MIVKPAKRITGSWRAMCGFTELIAKGGSSIEIMLDTGILLILLLFSLVSD